MYLHPSLLYGRWYPTASHTKTKSITSKYHLLNKRKSSWNSLIYYVQNCVITRLISDSFTQNPHLTSLPHSFFVYLIVPAIMQSQLNPSNTSHHSGWKCSLFNWTKRFNSSPPKKNKKIVPILPNNLYTKIQPNCPSTLYLSPLEIDFSAQISISNLYENGNPQKVWRLIETTQRFLLFSNSIHFLCH